jgi:hypothetical protein
MKRESTEPDVVDLAAYRATRNVKSTELEAEIVTNVHFAVTRAGTIVPSSVRVAELHVLTVLAWCLDISNNMLDTYIGSDH